jgi:RND superfamily putative drug exporter
VLVLVVWLVVLVASAGGALTLSGPTGSTLSIPGQESSEALTRITSEFGSGASADVVLALPKGVRADSPQVLAVVEDLREELGALKGVVSVSDPFSEATPTIAPDLSSVMLTATFSVPAAEVTKAQRDAVLSLAGTLEDGTEVDVKGDATQTVVEVLGPTEVIGVLVAFGVLALTYASLAAAGMNLLTAVVGVGIGAGSITALSGFVELQSTTSVLAVMLGLAVGIDYALFIISRHRSELRRGRSVDEAVRLASGTAGSAVLTAGLTVVIALAGLSVAGIPFLTEMGLAAAGAVVVAVLVALTLVPASLALLGLRVLPKRDRHAPGQSKPSAGAERVYAGLITRLERRRGAVLVLGSLVLGVLAVPVLSMQTSMVQPYEPGSTQDRASEVVAERFGPGLNGPLVVLFEGVGSVEVAASALTEVQELDGVAAAVGPVPAPSGRAALLQVVPTSAPTSPATEELVHQIRTLLGGEANVTGATAVSVDVAEQLRTALVLYLALVVGLAFVLLVMVFRSVWVPLVGVLGFLLTTGATLGVSVAVFQWGWLSGAFGVSEPAPILSIMPIIVVGILFGLAMDYQVFLVSRMHEAHHAGVTGQQAVHKGFLGAAPTVVAAASIMLAVFAGFVPTTDPGIKAIAFALSAGILFDAFVVRLLLVPAALGLLGDRAWILPRALRWLPVLDVEGRALEGSSGGVKE